MDEMKDRIGDVLEIMLDQHGYETMKSIDDYVDDILEAIQPPELEKCVTCRFWFIDQGGKGEGGYDGDGSYSTCRRHAPVSNKKIDRGSYFAGGWTLWPFTKKDDWCGDWEQCRTVQEEESND